MGSVPVSTAGWVRAFLEWGLMGVLVTVGARWAGADWWAVAAIWCMVAAIWLLIGRLWWVTAKQQRDPNRVTKRCIWCDRQQVAQRGRCTVCPTCQADMVEP